MGREPREGNVLMSFRAAVVGSLLLLMSVGCSGSREEALESAELKAADETVAVEALEAPRECVKALARLETGAALNLREGPSSTAHVLLTMPEGSELSISGASGCPENGYYPVRFGGFTGWAYGAHLRTSTSTLVAAISAENSRDEAVARAQSGVGFSYWWGHGRWLETGATSTNKGSCSGSCPSCTHSGSYGADCSGFAAKVWVVPSSNNDLSVDAHPYSTAVFENEYHGWHNVARADLKRADAMVYNTDGAGHIFIYDRTDQWGNVFAYECKGCVDGCVEGFRGVSASYKGIGRDGIVDSLPDPSTTFTGRWYLRDANSAGANNIPGIAYGGAGDIPMVGDWDGNGTSTVGVYRAGVWYLRNSNTTGSHTVASFAYGGGTDIPLVGDWDGNGTDTVGVYKSGVWYLRNANTAGAHTVPSFSYGGGTDIPVVGDWDGDGTDTVGVYRGGIWYLRNSNTAGSHTIPSFAYGGPNDIPVVGDWDGDGIDTVGVVKNGVWYLRNSNTAGAHTIPSFAYGAYATDKPVVGDWNADGTTTIGVAR
jgi:SH3 domain-containing protein